MNFLKRKIGDIFGFTKRIDGLVESAKFQAKLLEDSETKRNDVIASETRLRERLNYQHSRNDSLRDALSRKTAEYDELSVSLQYHIDVAIRSSAATGVVAQNFMQALDRIADMLKGDGQAFKEAEKFYSRFCSTKNCFKCGSEMIPLRSEDKKLCSNGACGHEVDWPLEEGQDYMHKRNVEPFIEDRSNVPAAIEE